MKRFGTPRILSFLFLLLLLFALPVLAVAATAADPAAAPSFVDWFRANLTAVFGICLGISELMASSPWFKGNGILHSIIEILKFMTSKDAPTITPPAA